MTNALVFHTKSSPVSLFVCAVTNALALHTKSSPVSLLVCAVTNALAFRASTRVGSCSNAREREDQPDWMQSYTAACEEADVVVMLVSDWLLQSSLLLCLIYCALQLSICKNHAYTHNNHLCALWQHVQKGHNHSSKQRGHRVSSHTQCRVQWEERGACIEQAGLGC